MLGSWGMGTNDVGIMSELLYGDIWSMNTLRSGEWKIFTIGYIKVSCSGFVS